MKQKLCCLLALAAAMLTCLCAAAKTNTHSARSWVVNPETGETQSQFAARTRWWRHARFGMFIHWGIYSVPAHGEWYFSNGLHKDPKTGKMVHWQVADYAKFAKQFDPVQFNAMQWMKVAKAAGMKYVVITAKHHDGFCMFHTNQTHYNVVQDTPWHHDPMKDLQAATQKEGLKLCFYYSFMDWHNPLYLPRRPWDIRPTTGASLNAYIQYVKAQLKELLTQYGPIGIIWFDGGWEHSAAQMHSLQIVKWIRSLQPNILINDRMGIPEDYATPEQHIPATGLGGRLWETCMTINNDWGYNKNDFDFKSPQTLIQNLCDIASKGGNYLLNVGPTAQGIIPQPEVDRLLAMGRWMKVNSQAIYGTKASPFAHLPAGMRVTRRGSVLYLMIFGQPHGPLSFDGLKTPVRSARCLLTGQNLAVSRTTRQQMPVTTIAPPKRFSSAVTVIKLQLAGRPVVENAPIAPSNSGVFTLAAGHAKLTGGLQLETEQGKKNIGFWTNSAASATWTVYAPAAGDYKVTMRYSCQPGAGGSVITLSGSSQSCGGLVNATAGWSDYHTLQMSGILRLKAGRQKLTLQAVTMPGPAVMNLRRIVLTAVR